MRGLLNKTTDIRRRVDIVNKAKSPCIGVCSTGIGDNVCRGCKRYAKEVINWNAYTDEERRAITDRLDSLLSQVVAGKISVVDEALLKQALVFQNVKYDSYADSHCWVFSLLKAGASQINNIEDYGCLIKSEWREVSLERIRDLIDKDFYTLSCVHYERYFKT